MADLPMLLTRVPVSSSSYLFVPSDLPVDGYVPQVMHAWFWSWSYSISTAPRTNVTGISKFQHYSVWGLVNPGGSADKVSHSVLSGLPFLELGLRGLSIRVSLVIWPPSPVSLDSERLRLKNQKSHRQTANTGQVLLGGER